MKAAKSVTRDVKVLLILYISWSTVGANVIELTDSRTTDDDRVAFIEQGPPVVTYVTEQFFKAKCFQFVPQYDVLVDNRGNKESAYVFLQTPTKINETFFHLYGPRHPDTENYQIETRSSNIVIKKCKKPKDCKKLTKCEQLSIRLQKNVTDVPFSEKIVFISWETSSEILTILVQYGNRQTKCIDVNPFGFKKIVINSTEQQPQQYSIIRQKFMRITWSNHSGPLFEPQKFNLTSQHSVYVQILLQCLCCEVVASLNCNNFTDRIYLPGNNASSMMSDNNVEFPAWEDIILPKQKINKTLTDCLLTINKGESNSCKENDFFEKVVYFGKSVVNITLPDSYYVKTKRHYLPGIPEIVKCPNCEIDFSVECGNESYHTIRGLNSSCNYVVKWNDKIELLLREVPNNCTLMIVADADEKCLNDTFWKVITGTSRVLEPTTIIDFTTMPYHPITSKNSIHTTQANLKETRGSQNKTTNKLPENSYDSHFTVLVILHVSNMLLIFSLILIVLFRCQVPKCRCSRRCEYRDSTEVERIQLQERHLGN